MKAAIIPANISQQVRFEEIRPNPETFRQIVGEMIEYIGIRGRDINMCLNEEGKMLKLPINTRATRIARITNSIRHLDFISGDVVIVGPIDDDRDTGLSTEDIAWIDVAKGADGHPETTSQI